MGDMTITLIDEAHYDAEMDAKVLPALQACLTEGRMKPATHDSDGKALPTLDNPGTLHYCCYDVRKFNESRGGRSAGPFRGAVVISHGFTEFGRKYSEMVWYFLLAGYSVCVFEHRGHGHSAHDMSNPSLVWIDDWRRYVADFATFASTVGREYAMGRPLDLYCHSMGGGIGAAVLERYPSLFDKAVLSAPMIAPAVGMPTWVARIVVGGICALGFGKSRVFGHATFPTISIWTIIAARPKRASAGSTSNGSPTNAVGPMRRPSSGRIRPWRYPVRCSNPTCAVPLRRRRCSSRPGLTCGCSTVRRTSSSNVCAKAAVP